MVHSLQSPSDFTPVCTTEFVASAKRYEDFQALNSDLIVLSVGSKISHIKLVKWIEQNLDTKIPFPVIADPMGRVSEELELLHQESSQPQLERSILFTLIV